jgi:hypothetical protein
MSGSLARRFVASFACIWAAAFLVECWLIDRYEPYPLGARLLLNGAGAIGFSALAWAVAATALLALRRKPDGGLLIATASGLAVIAIAAAGIR